MATGDHDWIAGEVMAASNVDDYLQLQTVQQYATTGARDTALASRKRTGMVTANADARNLTVYTGTAWSSVGPVYGAGATWGASVTSGAAYGVTINRESYTRTGRWVQGYARLTITSITGVTTGTQIAVTLPVAANLSASELMTLGTGVIKTVAGTNFMYFGELVLATSSSFCYLQVRTNGAAASYLGVSAPTVLAVNDQIVYNFAYEAAADA